MQDNESHVDELLRHSRAIKSDAAALLQELRQTADEVNRSLDLKGRMERHPYATLAAAMGVGYVLGGGVFTRLTARALRMGARAVLFPMIRAQLTSLGENLAASRAPAPGFAGSEDGQGGM